MKLRLLAFLVYLILAVVLMFLLTLVIDEHMSRRQTQWDEWVSEFEQADKPEGAVSLRPSGKN